VTKRDRRGDRAREGRAATAAAASRGGLGLPSRGGLPVASTKGPSSSTPRRHKDPCPGEDVENGVHNAHEMARGTGSSHRSMEVSPQARKRQPELQKGSC